MSNELIVKAVKEKLTSLTSSIDYHQAEIDRHTKTAEESKKNRVELEKELKELTK